MAWLEDVASGKDWAADGPATEIHLVGDLFDFWFEYRRSVPKGGVRLMGAIARIADAGIPIHYHVGNHDLWSFGYLRDELGVSIHHDPIVREYDGLRCMIGHGDGLGPGDHRYKFLKRIFSSPLLQFGFRMIHPDWGIALASRLSRNSRATSGLQDDTFNGPEGEWLWHYCQSILAHHPIDCFFFGHRHLPLDLAVPHPDPQQLPARYINLGDWLHHFSAARIVNGTAFLEHPTATID